jgi:hypothetical protein
VARNRSWWIERSIAAALLVAVAWPFWSGRFLPFLDLPQHLALSAAIVRYEDASTGFARYYSIDWHVTPYWGFYAAMYLIMKLGFDVLTASRLLFSAYAVALPLSTGYLLASLHRDWRWAAFSLPLVYNTNLFWGFASFVLSVPLFLVALGLAARMLAARAPGAADRLGAACAAALLYMFHAQTFALFGLSVLALFAIHWQGVRWALHRAVPFALSLLLFLPWFWRGVVSPRVLKHDVPAVQYEDNQHEVPLRTRYEPLSVVLSKIPERLVGAYNDGSDYRIAAGLLGLFCAAVIAAGRRTPGRLRAALIERRGEVLCALLFVSYVAVPIELWGQWYVSPRHLLFAALLAPACLVAPATGVRLILLVPVCVLGLVASADAAEKVRAFQDQVGPFWILLDKMEPGKRVMNLMFDDGAAGPVRYWPFLHWSCYYQALKGGDVSFSLAGTPGRSIAAQSIPVTYRPGMQAPHPDVWRPRDFRWNTMGPAYDYFLVRGRPSGDAARLGDHADLVAQLRDWQLWHRSRSRQ